MEAATLRRDFFTSLVGAVPLVDVLGDLPLPSHEPTPMESTILGGGVLSLESRKLLESTDPSLCSKITKALVSVDTSFLQLKNHVSTDPYLATSQDPPLIFSIFRKGLQQPTLKLNKVDPTKYTSPSNSSSAPSTPLKPITEPNQSIAITEPPKPTKQRVKKLSRSARGSSSDTNPLKPSASRTLQQQQQQTQPPTSYDRTQTLPHNSTKPPTSSEIESRTVVRTEAQSAGKEQSQQSSRSETPSRVQQTPTSKAQTNSSRRTQHQTSVKAEPHTSSRTQSQTPSRVKSERTHSHKSSKAAFPRSPTPSSDVNAEPKRRKKLRRESSISSTPAGSKSMWVSIDCRNLPSQKSLVSGSAMRVTKKRAEGGEKQPVPSEHKMVVRVQRGKLRGKLGNKFQDPPPPLPAHPPAANLVLPSLEEGVDLEREPLKSFVMKAENTPNQPQQQRPSKKRRRHQHNRQGGDPAKAAALKHYTSLLSSLLDSEDQLTSADNLLSRTIISQLVSETAKLKLLCILHEVSVDSLVRLITTMDQHVLDSAELLMSSAADESEGDSRAWREAVRERILRSTDAALVILHINTAPNMPKNVHLEESLEQVISVTKFHLENNIYPVFDAVYRAGKKESGVLPRQKRRYGGSSTNKDVQAVYRRLTEVMENFALLLETQHLTDTTVLQISSLGTFPFFVENVSSLQLSALRLVRAIFSRYEKHRDLILEDIFASLARLPTTKRNLRSFKLSNGDSVQMVTALILQLVQCIVARPQEEDQTTPTPRPDTPTSADSNIEEKSDPDVQLVNSYELALRTGKTFLSTFMKKCCGGKDEDDFRPLFDNFVHDLLTTLNLPEWPASEVLLTLLGVLLVHSFSNRNNEQSLRVTSLDHLGVIAARLRRDAADSVDHEHDDVVSVLSQVMQIRLEQKSPSPTGNTRMDAFSENSKYFQKALVAYLNRRSSTDPSCTYARDFYIAQWLRDTDVELEKAMKGSSDDVDDLTLEESGEVPAISSSALALQQAEIKKNILHSLISNKSQASLKYLDSILDDRSASLVTRYLASCRALSRSFDVYLQQLLRVLNEPEVRIRTRAMKALSSIIDADPTILSRPDMQRAVQFRFMDQSTLVREAAVDLLGRFMLSRPELTSQYFDMLSERILDTGVSVRRRVIKILKDICILQPQFPRTSEICVKMMRRIADEEGIKQLVTSVFKELWFTLPPKGADQRETLERRVAQITAVVGSCKEYEWFEQLLEQLLRSEDQATIKTVLEVSQMMVDCLVESLLALDETSATTQASSSSRLVTCITTLYLFCKTRPSLLLRHATTLHPYLGSKCSTQGDMMVLHYVAQILRQVVPLMEHPSNSFLASLEEDLVKLVMKHGQMIVQSCVHCLGAVVNSVTLNYALVKDCFQKFFMLLDRVQTLHSQNPRQSQLAQMRPSLLRSVFTVGLLCKHFDIDTIVPQSPQARSISQRVFSQLIYFSQHEDEEVQLKAMTGLGFYCVRYPQMMLDQEAKQLYQAWLTQDTSSKKKCQVLRNLQHHLKEVETTLKVADVSHTKESDNENLLEFGDQQSNISSNIAQAFLSPVLESFLNSEIQVRLGAVQALLLILRQGLVHPEQCIPYLITISTDIEASVRVKANHQLTEHNGRYGHFVQTTLMAGIKKSFEFQKILFGVETRGYTEQNSSPSSLLSHVYSLVRSNKQHRRAMLRAILRYFEDYERNPLGLLLYLADNLAYFPYSTLEEPLFVVHNVDMTISVTGSNILQSFREALGGLGAVPDEEEDDVKQLSQHSCDAQQLAECCHSSQACFLLLLLKQHLKRLYGLTDSKCQHYSPTESNKAFDKAVNRRSGVLFEPKSVLQELRRDHGPRASLRSKEDYLKQYVEFKQLMNRLDPFEEGEDSDRDTAAAAPPPSSAPAAAISVLPPSNSSAPPQQDKPDPLLMGAPPPPPTTHSRASSTSSSASTGSRRTKRTSSAAEKGRGGRGGGTQPRAPKRRRRFFSSDSDEDEDH